MLLRLADVVIKVSVTIDSVEMHLHAHNTKLAVLNLAVPLGPPPEWKRQAPAYLLRSHTYLEI